MKRGLSHTLVVIGLFTFAITATQAQTTANGPYYATPSWDQTLPAATRFIVLSNMNSEAVLDRETGLVWSRSPEPRGPSPEIGTDLTIFGCSTRVKGGRGGWRLPRLHELNTLFEPTAPAGSVKLPAGHPFLNVEDTGYFATLELTNGLQIATINFVTGAYSFGGTQLGVRWCVRTM